MSGFLDLLSSFFTETSGCSKPVHPPRRNVQKESKELEQFNTALAAALEKLDQQQADPVTQDDPAPQAAPDQQADPVTQDDPAPQAAPDQQADPVTQDDPAPQAAPDQQADPTASS